MAEMLSKAVMRRSVKKTTNDQFDLLKAEMALHPAAARGYGVGANRQIVDAEWRDIVEKLNEIGPPHRTMTEWKKVWSDVRLRIRKRFCEELMNEGQVRPVKPLKKPKKEKVETAEDELMDALNSSTSIYHPNVQNNDEEDLCITPNIHKEEESQHHDEYYEHNPLDEEELHSNHHNDSNNHYNSDFPSSHDATQSHYNEDKLGFMEQTMYTLQNQMEHQNKLMEHLSQITSNMAAVMERHVTVLEKKTNIMERQLKASEYHNVFLRRQEARRRTRDNSVGLSLNKS